MTSLSSRSPPSSTFDRIFPSRCRRLFTSQLFALHLHLGTPELRRHPFKPVLQKASLWGHSPHRTCVCLFVCLFIAPHRKNNFTCTHDSFGLVKHRKLLSNYSRPSAVQQAHAGLINSSQDVRSGKVSCSPQTQRLQAKGFKHGQTTFQMHAEGLSVSPQDVRI